MDFRIDKLVAPGGRLLFRVSGRFDKKATETLREMIGKETSELAIDLEEVSTINREAVLFFARSESRGIELRNCPLYLREWITRERDGI